MDRLSDHIPEARDKIESGEADLPEPEPTASEPKTSKNLPSVVSRSSNALSAMGLDLQDLQRSADKQTVIRAINMIELAMGIEGDEDEPGGVSSDRRSAIAISILGNGYTQAQVMLAAQELCSDPELDEKLRYGGALTAADFTRVIEEDDSITSAGKVYSYWEAREYWNRMGEPGTFPDSLFSSVEIEGETKWVLR